jgi:hypothetical protein
MTQYDPIATLRAWRAEIADELEQAVSVLAAAAGELQAAQLAARAATAALRSQRAALGQTGPLRVSLPSPLAVRLRELEDRERAARAVELRAAAAVTAAEAQAAEIEAAIAQLHELLQQPAEAA